MSGKELLRKMIKNGWTEDRVEGSHHILKKGNRTEVVPVHGNKDLPKGLLNAILKRTELNDGNYGKE